MQGRWKFYVAGLLAVAVVVAVAVSWKPKPESLPQEPPGRMAYELSLQETLVGKKFDPPFDVVRKDGFVWLRKDYQAGLGVCSYRCGVLETNGANHFVSLPVGYEFDANVVPFPAELLAVNRLVFWDPYGHKQVTVTQRDGDSSVRVPEQLLRRNIDAVSRAGEVVYTTPDYVRDTGRGLVVLKGVGVSPEWLGYPYAYDARARRVRTNQGFEACLPEGYVPIKSEADGIPVKLLKNCS